MTTTAENRPLIIITIQDKNYTALVDTGAGKSYIGELIVSQCCKRHLKSIDPTVKSVRLADGHIATVKKAFPLKMQIGSQTVTETFNYLPNLTVDLIVGMDILQKYNFSIDISTAAVYLRKELLPKPTCPTAVNLLGEITDKPLLTLTATEEAQLKAFLETELPSLTDLRGTTPLVQHRIHLTDPEPIKQRYYPQNPRMQGVINAEVDKMLKDDIIEPSTSPWSSPIVMARKKNGTYRFCVNFKKVNDVSRKDAYPLPYINAILDKLRKARYISSLDLKEGYWQVPLAPESRQITAFTVPSRGLFQFRVMPFGLHSAPATFQRLMDLVIGPEMDPYCFAYLDDIIVLGETFEQHLSLLTEVFHRLRSANLRLNPEKCQFGRRSLQYLGHLVTAEGIHTDPEKVASIRQLPPPSNVKGIRRFLGIASWYRRFVPDFSKIAAPLNRLLKKGIAWQWSEEQDEAFRRLKDGLTSAPVLACPNFEKPFILQTDASDQGLGVALIQHDKDGDHVVAYASRSLTDSEKKYSVTEKECLAIVWGVEKMRPYLEGYRFTVLTDHQSLRWLHSIKSPSGRLARWSIFLQQFDFEIKYRQGILNRVADALSRDPLPSTSKDEEFDPLGVLDEEEPVCSWYRKKKAEVEKNPEVFPDFCVREGKLFRHFWDNDLSEPDLVEPWKLCVPKPSRQSVIEENHDAPTAGHMGITKTIARVASRYYWPGMFRDIARYVRQCPSCLRYKPSQQQLPGKMQPSPITEPGHTVSTDIVGPLPRSTRGNRFLLVFQDRFTKWVQCRPVRSATAKSVTQALYEEIIVRFGTPKVVITDNGTQYTGHHFAELLSSFGIKHRLTPAYTPQANPVERTNRTLKTMIAQYCGQNHRLWDRHLKDFEFAINTARNDSTGYTPAFLTYGRELDVPQTIYPRPNNATTDDTDIKPRTDRLKLLQDIFQLVKINLNRAFTTQSRYYNLRRRDWRCRPGDHVMKRDHKLSSAIKGIAAKLTPRYSGPYTVVRVVSPVVYDLRAQNGKLLRHVHVKDLKPAGAQDSFVPDNAEHRSSTGPATVPLRRAR